MSAFNYCSGLLSALLLASLLVVTTAAAPGISCRDESGKPVDWWVIFKVPHLTGSSDPNAASGFGYAYADSDDPTLSMTANRLDKNIDASLGATLEQIYSAGSDAGYIMYNDETPDNKEHGSFGHTKGDMAFDADGGFWLVHSVPRFPANTGSGVSYEGYPAYAATYGQSFLCMSMNLDNLDNAASAFLLNKPYVYDSNMPDALKPNMPNLAAVLDGDFIKEEATNVTAIKTVGGTVFTVFSKNGKWNQDLYSGLVAPTINSDLTIETWMNGDKSNKMPSFCRPEVNLDNVNVKNLNFSDDVAWKETQDHSKWVLAAKGTNIVCIGDINRQYSQAKRGGGTVCIKSSKLWTSINGIIADTEACQ
ncbi:deoxyribonuclease II protein, putative [Acanthamoeba castellanii str. Neff]|uniref:Deoxyribonuclease II protein, putative n=1 Tax=Acanthamoeba castellanii (strain ATCC 30010 / Neff) TaxID=1257118 RepID=L8GW79_ACACF|nr:deoxyribonuclease II protein, putative [Acanthamoeba castellanii str. Neff]ELR16858.1 deoxyribonuclease II protein, putative [Acanthamoeba castellanii str. Neff]